MGKTLSGRSTRIGYDHELLSLNEEDLLSIPGNHLNLQGGYKEEVQRGGLPQIKRLLFHEQGSFRSV